MASSHSFTLDQSDPDAFCYDKTMINLKNKPITFSIAVSLLGMGMLVAVGFVIYMLSSSFFALKGAGLGAVIYVPAVTLYIVQIVFYVVLGWFLLQRIYRWSIPAIIVSTIACPIALLVIMASIANQFGYAVDLSSPIGVGLLIFLLLTPLIMGVIAYNDIHYRLPRI